MPLGIRSGDSPAELIEKSAPGRRTADVESEQEQFGRASHYLIFARNAGRRLSCAVNPSMARKVGGLMWCSMPSTS